jgi:hypothetical protein
LHSQTVLLEDLTMAVFIVSSFGVFVMSLFAGVFTAPSWQTFTVLAYGWAVASGERQTITTYLWLTGATTVKHFSCFYTFRGVLRADTSDRVAAVSALVSPESRPLST